MSRKKELESQEIRNNKSFCILPWIHSFVNIKGTYQVCCTGEEFNNYIMDNDGNPFKIQNQPSLDDVMNSEFMKKFRKQMIDGKLPSSCQRCAIAELNGGVSRRVIENEQYDYLIDSVLEGTDEDLSIKTEIFHADYRLGNICNLQCRMCTPNATKNWIQEYKNLPEEFTHPEKLKNLDKCASIDWYKKDLLLDEFSKKCMSLTRLHFGGGEPFYAKQMLDLLQICVEQGIAKNITVSYNTNLSLIPEKMLELWKEFKEVRLLVSIDGVGKVNDYIRYPSKWAVIDKNLKFLDENHEQYNITEIMFSATVQANNLFHLPEIFDYLNQFKFIRKLPNLIPLYYPRHLSVLCLPQKLRVISSLKLKSLLKELSRNVAPEDEYLLQNIEQIISISMGKVGEEKERLWFDRFVRFSRAFDSTKDIKLEKVNPELAKYLEYQP